MTTIVSKILGCVLVYALTATNACDPNGGEPCDDYVEKSSESVRKSTDIVAGHLMTSIHEVFDDKQFAFANGILSRAMIQILASVQDAEIPHQLTVMGDENIRLVLFWARMFQFSNAQYRSVKSDICDLQYVVDCVNTLIDHRESDTKDRVTTVFTNIINGDIELGDLFGNGASFPVLYPGWNGNPPQYNLGSTKPTNSPTTPTMMPSKSPTNSPTTPTMMPTNAPTAPTMMPTNVPTAPTMMPTNVPTAPTMMPTNAPV